MSYRLVGGAWIKQDGTVPKQAVAVVEGSPKKAAARRGDLKRLKLNGVDMPFDADVERAVLGAMLVELSAVRVARQFLKSDMFMRKANQVIFEAVCRIADQGYEPDLVATVAEIRDAGIHEPGCGEYLAACIDKVASASHVEYHSKIVAELYIEREIIKSAYRLADGQKDEELKNLAKLHIEKTALSCPITFDYTTGMASVLNEILKPENSKRFQTHYPTMDKTWNGMKPGELNVWGGATNEGKSLFLLNLLDRASKAGERCLYVGTEMTSVETVERHLSIQSNVEAWKIRIPRIDDVDLSRLQKTVKVMSKMNVSILDDPEPNLAKIEAAIHSSKSDIIFLDYLERFEMPRADQLRLQIKEFMRQLKTMARRTNTVIHLAAQLNRDTYGVEQRAPTLADLSESSAIEKEADRVGLLWAPADAPVSKKEVEKGEVKETATLRDNCRKISIINAKSRHCPRGFVFDFVLDQNNLRIQELSEYNDPFNKSL